MTYKERMVKKRKRMQVGLACALTLIMVVSLVAGLASHIHF